MSKDNSELQVLSLDLGGSGTRVSYKRGNRKFRKSMVSRLRKIAAGAPVYTDIEDVTEDFQIKSDCIPDTMGRYVRGDASLNHKDGVSMQPVPGLKVSQTITYVNALHAIAKCLLPLKTQEVVDVKVGIVIPASEFCSEKGLLNIPKDFMSKGIHEVYFPVLKRTVKFQITRDNVKIGGEGMVYAMVLKKDPKYKEMFETSDGLIVDIGRRSSDLTPFKKGKPVKKAARSFPIGGVQIEANVSADLEVEERPVANEDIINIIAEGTIGGYNVAPFISKAKQVLAGSIREGITTVLAQAEAAAKNQSYIIFIGQTFIEEKGMSKTNAHYKGSLADDLLVGFPSNIEVITPADQEFVNCDAMLDLLLMSSK